MGNTFTDDHDFANQELIDKIERDFQKRGFINDMRFGRVQLYNHKHKTDELIIFKDKWTCTQEESKQLYNYVKLRNRISHPNLARLIFYEMLEDKKLTNTFIRHFMGFEYHSKTLETEIANRALIKENPLDTPLSTVKYYSESEIWYILITLADLIKTFNEHSYHHGDIQPRNIFVDSSRKIKLIDNSLINYGTAGYQKMLYEKEYKTTLSPLLIDSLKYEKVDPKHDKVKSDIFSVGITTLCAATNSNFLKYYDWERCRLFTLYKSPMPFNDNLSPPMIDRIQQDLDFMQKLGYSTELIDVITWILTIDQASRPSIEDLGMRLNLKSKVSKEKKIQPSESKKIVSSVMIQNIPQTKEKSYAHENSNPTNEYYIHTPNYAEFKVQHIKPTDLRAAQTKTPQNQDTTIKTSKQDSLIKWKDSKEANNQQQSIPPKPRTVILTKTRQPQPKIEHKESVKEVQIPVTPQLRTEERKNKNERRRGFTQSDFFG